MSEQENRLGSREFSQTDLKRLGIILAVFAGVAIVYWFFLPVIQSLVLPDASGGSNGPWVVRPIRAFRFGAMGVLAAVTVPFIITPLQRVWNREDAEDGSQFDPLRGRPVTRARMLVKSTLLFIVYACCLIIYLRSWTVVGPDGIEAQAPWGTSRYSYSEIVKLETIPDGERSESITQNGPWYSVRFKNAPSITLSYENEGITRDELSALTSFIAQRSGQNWVRKSDAQPRYAKKG